MRWPAIGVAIAAAGVLLGCGSDAPSTTTPPPGAGVGAGGVLRVSGALNGALADVQVYGGNCGVFQLVGKSIRVVDFRVMMARVGADAINLDLQVDPFTAPQAYRVSAPADSRKTPVKGKAVNGVVLIRPSDGATWLSSDGSGTITVDAGGVTGSVDATLTATSGGSAVASGSKVRLQGTWACHPPSPSPVVSPS